MMQLIYTIFYVSCLVFLAPAGLYTLLRRKEYRSGVGQRFALYPGDVRTAFQGTPGERCWVHAVSVGEMKVALPFVAALRERLPGLQVTLTTTTSEGRALARQRMPEGTDLLYFPYDVPWCQRRAQRLIQPDFIVLVEQELWPNHLRISFERGIPVFLINARMPAGEARRYRWARRLFSPLFSRMQLVCSQEKDDAARFADLGVPPGRLHTTGNLKFDAPPSQVGAPGRPGGACRETLMRVGVDASRPVLVAGSTHPGEEDLLLDIAAELRAGFPGLFLILAPRNIRRSPGIVNIAKRKRSALVLRSRAAVQGAPAGRGWDGMVVDTIGELQEFYDAASVIFVGKSLLGRGGQNIMEAAASGRPVVFGPNMQNFQAAASRFLASGGAVQVQSAGELREILLRLLRDPDSGRRIAEAAGRVLAGNRGATERTVHLVVQSLGSRSGRTGDAVSE